MVLRNEKWAFKGEPSWFTESTINGKGAKKIYFIEPNYYRERQMAQVSIIATYLLVQSSEHEI